MIFYKHFLGDYGRDTGHLTIMEHGAYRLLLDHYYSTERALPPDLPTLCHIARAKSKVEREAVDRVAGEFFPIGEDGQRHNRRADQEIAKRAAQVAINREIGKRGGRPKKTDSVSTEKPNGLLDENRMGFSFETDSLTEPKPNRNPSHSHSQITPPLVPPKGGNGQPRRRRERLPARPCPTSFEVTEDMTQWAESIGVPAAQVMTQTEVFLDHWRSKGTLRHDWMATWRNWMRKHVEFSRGQQR